MTESAEAQLRAIRLEAQRRFLERTHPLNTPIANGPNGPNEKTLSEPTSRTTSEPKTKAKAKAKRPRIMDFSSFKRERDGEAAKTTSTTTTTSAMPLEPLEPLEPPHLPAATTTTTTTTSTAATTTAAPRTFEADILGGSGIESSHVRVSLVPRDEKRKRALESFIEREDLSTKFAHRQEEEQEQEQDQKQENEWELALLKLRAPITAPADNDEVPHDTVHVYGHTIHRVLCPGRRGEVVALLSADLVALLGYRRVEEMRALVKEQQQRRSPMDATSLQVAESEGTIEPIDPRVFVTLQRCGLVPVPQTRMRTRQETRHNESGSSMLTPLELGLAFMALRHHSIITLHRQ
jgi:hypothetical protein